MAKLFTDEYQEKCDASNGDILKFAASCGYRFPESLRIEVECVVQNAELGWMNGTEQDHFESDYDCTCAYLEGCFNQHNL